MEAVRGEGRFVVATFRLTERSGPGARPCDGAGNLAATAFLIEHRRIVEWLRAAGPGRTPDNDDTRRSRRGDSNPWPTTYKVVALPAELLRRGHRV